MTPGIWGLIASKKRLTTLEFTAAAIAVSILAQTH